MQRVIAIILCSAVFSGLVGIPQAVSAAYPAVYAGGVLAHTNAQRYYNGLPLLESNPDLSRIAARKMQDLFARQYFAHDAPTGEDVSDLADSEGYVYLAVGENLALGDFGSSKEVVQAWMESPGHRANILATKFTEIGIAAGRSMHNGHKAWVVVQAFGLPRSSCPAPDSVLKRDMDALADKVAILETIARIRENLLKEDGLSVSAYNKRVASYNLAVELHNEHVKEYRVYIAEYNKTVDAYNTCLSKKTS
jgi:hypothetical protein